MASQFAVELWWMNIGPQHAAELCRINYTLLRHTADPLRMNMLCRNAAELLHIDMATQYAAGLWG